MQVERCDSSASKIVMKLKHIRPMEKNFFAELEESLDEQMKNEFEAMAVIRIFNLAEQAIQALESGRHGEDNEEEEDDFQSRFPLGIARRILLTITLNRTRALRC